MNPYTYTKRNQDPVLPAAPGFLRAVFTAKISGLMAFAIILLAAGSTAAITPLVTAQMGQGQEYALAVTHAAPKLVSAVLGDSTTMPVSQQPPAVVTKIFYASNLKLAIQPAQFDPGSGNWNYKVMWSRPTGRSGSIYINGNVFVGEATGTGVAYTGFTLTPQSRYHIVFYSQANGQGVRIANRYFTTLPVPIWATPNASSGIAPDVEDTSGTSGDNTAGTTTPNNGPAHAVGTLINQNGTIFLVVPGGKLGIPDAATFESWNYSFGDAVPANAADQALPVVGIVLQREGGDSGEREGAVTAPSAMAHMPTSTLSVLISIPHNIVPAGLPVRAAAASEPRQDVTFSFNWGDGTTDTATSTSAYFMDSHAYAAAGAYTFTATATGNSGVTASKTATVNVGTSTSASLLPPPSDHFGTSANQH